jgi:adenosyl cobinamide kinase/adenosyl cobinamide phosphate guanylyltransferase
VRRTLVLGGARSGKSAHAEGLLTDAPATYVATARTDPDDAEWTARIAAHVRRRPATWRTVELPDPAELPRFLERAGGRVLVDDVATWLAALLDDADAWDGGSIEPVERHCGELVAAFAASLADVVLVSAEVGLGVVPATRSGRLFRDQLGALNAALADRCTDVVLLVAGIPLRLR